MFNKFLRKKKIYFVFFSFGNLHYTPLDVGYIMALIKSHENDFSFEIIQHDVSYLDTELSIRKKIDEQVGRIISARPRAVFFFLDNIDFSRIFAKSRAKKLAAELRRAQPSLYLGVQSYKLTDSVVSELLSNGLFDSAIGNDPEGAFISLSSILLKRFVPGVDHGADYFTNRNRQGAIEKKEKPTIRNLDDILPSPYLGHVLDPYLSNKKAEFGAGFTAFLSSSRGCRFRCYYCARSVKYERIKLFSPERFYDEMEYLNNKFGFQNFFVLDDSFVISNERLRQFASEFKRRKDKCRRLSFVNLFVMVRPENLNEESINLLRNINVVSVQIGLQTTNPVLQKYMTRSMDMERFIEIAQVLRKHSIRFCIDLISGLPNDTPDDFRRSLDFAVGLVPTTVQINQFSLSPGTLFFDERKKYGIEMISASHDFLVPHVVKASGIDDSYHRKTYNYAMETARANPRIKWRIVTKKGVFISH